MYTRHESVSRREGFTLVEVAVALSVLVIIMLPLATALHATGAIRSDTETTLRMGMAAANRLEQLKLEGLTLNEYEAAYPANGKSFTPSGEETTNLIVSKVTGTIRTFRPPLALVNALIVEVEISYRDKADNLRQALVSTVFRQDPAS